MPPAFSHTGVPGLVALAHFHSSTISESAPRMTARTRASVSPRQSSSSAIRASICSEASTGGSLDGLGEAFDEPADEQEDGEPAQQARDREAERLVDFGPLRAVVRIQGRDDAVLVPHRHRRQTEYD